MKKLKFLRWLYKIIHKKLHQQHLEVYKSDIKCPRCNEWFSITGVFHKHAYTETQPDWGASVICGQCKEHSHWNLEIAPVAIRCNEKGNPL